jgi:hypothetical protein
MAGSAIASRINILAATNEGWSSTTANAAIRK